MTLIPELAAFCRASERVVPSMAAITRTLTPLVIMFSICASWLGMSSSAYCRLVPYPLLFRVLTILSPSAIQRADDFVGMEMPMVPLSWAKACGVSDISPTANVIKTNLNDFIFFGGHNQCTGATRDRSRDDRRLCPLCKEKFYFLPLYIPSERTIHLEQCDPSPESATRT